ncbi:MAG: hypothetical protein KC668_23675 [Myxococcales bacterium]|nr:hypothetical protein [Myxococcales bacterium]
MLYLRVAVLVAGAAVALGGPHSLAYGVTTYLGAAALLCATRGGSLPSWPVALGTWVLVSRIADPLCFYASYRTYDPQACWPPPATLVDATPGWALFQLALALALWPASGAPHATLRRTAAVWAAFQGVDAVVEAAVVHGLSQVPAWWSWTLAWSWLGHACALAATLSVAGLSFVALRRALAREELDPRTSRRGLVGAVFACALLAPALARHAAPWDVRGNELDALAGLATVNSLRADEGVSAEFSTNHVLVAEPDGRVRDAQTGEERITFPPGDYGLVMDRGASAAEFARVAQRVIGAGWTSVHWVQPHALDSTVADVLPTRYTVQGVASRRLVHTGVVAQGAARSRLVGDEYRALSELLHDDQPLATLGPESGRVVYAVAVDDPVFAWARARPASLHPQQRLVRDSAAVIRSRLWPLLGGLGLGYLAFAALVARDLARLARRRREGRWVPRSETSRSASDVPVCPAWMPPVLARWAHIEGPAYRERVVAHAASHDAVRSHLARLQQHVTQSSGLFVGLLLVCVLAMTIAAEL